MPNLPPLSRLSLSRAVLVIAGRLGIPPLRPEAGFTLYDALCNGALKACGREEGRDGRLIQLDAVIPPEFWSALTGEEFLAQHSSPRILYQGAKDQRPHAVRYFAKITIGASDIDNLNLQPLGPSQQPEENSAQQKSRGRTGTAGRPSSADLCKVRMETLHREGKLPCTLAETSRIIIEWLAAQHPAEPRPKPKSLQNSLAQDYRRLKGTKSTP
jgi:hypothetical protein